MSGNASPGGPSYAISGWIEAAAYVLTIGALSLTYAYGHSIGAHPVAFILYAMLVSAIAMLAFTGFGDDAMAVMLHPKSWIVGAAIILIEIFYYIVLGYVALAHGTTLIRIGIPMAMVAGALFFARRPPPLALVSAAIIAAAVVFAIGQAPANVQIPLALAAALTGFFMVVRGFAAEFHPWNRAAKTVTEKIRITGLVVLVTSMMSLAVTALATGLMVLGLLPPLSLVPTVSALTHVPTILLGCLVGGVVLTLMAYLNFSSVVKITTENFMAMMAFTPVAAWIAQSLGAAAGLITVVPVENWLIAVMAVLVASVLLIFWAGRRARLRAA